MPRMTKAQQSASTTVCSSPPPSAAAAVPSYYTEGDIPSDWAAFLLGLDDLNVLAGTWEVIPDRSDACDCIMSKLGVSAFKRSFLRSYKSRNEVKILDASSDVPQVHIKTMLPMGVVKEGSVPVNGGSVQQLDPDTKVIWVNESLFADGRLYQKRVSSLGVMYDIRCVFDKDPEGRIADSPMFLFRWTFIDSKGEKNVVNRWMKKIVK